MTQLSMLAVYALLFFVAPSEDPGALLNEVTEKITKAERPGYTVKFFYPTPMGRIESLQASTQFQKNTGSLLGYDFIIRMEDSDVVYLDGTMRTVNHSDKTVALFPTQRHDEQQLKIENLRYIKYSPIRLLVDQEWEYSGDTTVEGMALRRYFRVTNDQVVDGNTIYTEQHIFLNPASKMLERVERRNYFKGELSQTLIFTYSDYELNNSGNLSYDFPQGYTSVISGAKDGKGPLQVGQKAPLFFGEGLDKNPLNLVDFGGKRILLDFSVINCGYCKLSLDHFNRADYQLPENISVLYINPEDDTQDIAEYAKKMNIPFPVIPDAKEIGEMYGVSGYPTFFLIDEQGVIEQTVQGYDKDFLESLQD